MEPGTAGLAVGPSLPPSSPVSLWERTVSGRRAGLSSPGRECCSLGSRWWLGRPSCMAGTPLPPLNTHPSKYPCTCMQVGPELGPSPQGVCAGQEPALGMRSRPGAVRRSWRTGSRSVVAVRCFPLCGCTTVSCVLGSVPFVGVTTKEPHLHPHGRLHRCARKPRGTRHGAGLPGSQRALGSVGGTDQPTGGGGQGLPVWPPPAGAPPLLSPPLPPLLLPHLAPWLASSLLHLSCLFSGSFLKKITLQ